MDSLKVPFYAFAALSIAFTLLTFGLGWLISSRLLRPLRAGWGALKEHVGATPVLRVVALALACLIGPKSAPVLAWSVLRLYLDLVALIPLHILRYALDLPTSDGRIDLSQGVRAVLVTYANAFDDAARRFADFGASDLADIALFIAVWGVVGYALSVDKGDAGAAGRTRLRGYYERLNPHERKNLALGGVLLVGGFLALAAIIAIPVLEPAGQSAVSEETLAKELDALTLDKALADWTPPESPMKALLAELKPAAEQKPVAEQKPAADKEANPVKSASALVPQEKEQEHADGVAQLRGIVEDRAGAWNDRVPQLWQRLLNWTKADLARAQLGAKAAYRVSAGSDVGNRESLKHYREIVRWYRTHQTDANFQLASCRDAINQAAEVYRGLANETLAALKRPGVSLVGYASQDYWPERVAAAAAERCEGHVSLDDPPDRAQLGASLGPAGWIARWLVESETMSVVLIFGMLGFGIFGSAISRFIRTREKAPDAVTREVAAPVLSGSAAAVVVFLGVHGGMAAFTSGSSGAQSAPNPHMVLLTCFIAAIFSEKVWDWAREQASARFQTGAGGAPPKEEQAPPPPKP